MTKKNAKNKCILKKYLAKIGKWCYNKAIDYIYIINKH